MLPKTIDIVVEKVPFTRLAAVVFSIISLFSTIAVGYATYKEQFTQVKLAVQKQEQINDSTQSKIIDLQLAIARLQIALDKNTEALIKNASKR